MMLCGTSFAAWQKVTSVADGDVVLLVATSNNYSKEFAGVNMGSRTPIGVAVDFSGNPAGTYTLKVSAGETAGTFALYSDNSENSGYLAWNSGNELRAVAEIAENALWTIEFDEDGNAIIKNVATPERQLQYNASSPRFACYTSTQASVQLMKDDGTAVEPEPEPEPEPTTTDWVKTTTIAVGDSVILVSEAYNYEFAGVGAHGRTYYGTALTYTTVPSGKYVLTVEAGSAANTYAFKIEDMENSGYLAWNSGNELRLALAIADNASWTVQFDEDGNADIVNVVSDNGDERVLQFNANSGQERFAAYKGTEKEVQFYKKTTPVAISTASLQNKDSKVIYNLAGQRVAQPVKGLYIVGGKKVIVK